MKKVLFVDDDKFLVRAYSSLFKKEGFETMYLEDGIDVVDTVKREKPDLVVLDVIMPQKDGFSVLKTLRSDDEVKNCKVITLSVLEQKEDIEKLKDLGVIKHIVKSDLTFKNIIKLLKEELSK